MQSHILSVSSVRGVDVCKLIHQSTLPYNPFVSESVVDWLGV